MERGAQSGGCQGCGSPAAVISGNTVIELDSGCCVDIHAGSCSAFHSPSADLPRAIERFHDTRLQGVHRRAGRSDVRRPDQSGALGRLFRRIKPVRRAKKLGDCVSNAWSKNPPAAVVFAQVGSGSNRAACARLAQADPSERLWVRSLTKTWLWREYAVSSRLTLTFRPERPPFGRHRWIDLGHCMLY